MDALFKLSLICFLLNSEQKPKLEMSIVKTQEENNDFLSPHFSLSMLTGLVVSSSEFLNTKTGFLEAPSNLK